MNKGKKFDICLMNPPYPGAEQGGMYLDMQFVEKCNSISNINIVVYPGTRFNSNTKLGNILQGNGHLYSVDFFDADKVFKISTSWKYGGIYVYNNLIEHSNILVTNIAGETSTIGSDENSRNSYIDTIRYSEDIISLVEKFKPLYDELKHKNNTMVNDQEDVFIYEENRLQRGKTRFGVNKKDQTKLSRVKEYLSSGKYKYCLYKGSFNHEYDEVQEWKGEDPHELFKGQICWLMNKTNVRDNIKYWLECPLADFWRKYYFKGGKGTPGCMYGNIPALDFDQPVKDFRAYVDSLNNFSKEDIKVLKEYNIHNANKL